MQTMIIVDNLEFDNLLNINMEDLYFVIDVKNKIEFRSWLWKNHDQMKSSYTPLNIFDVEDFNTLLDAIRRAIFWHVQRMVNPFEGASAYHPWWEGCEDDIHAPIVQPILMLKNYFTPIPDIANSSSNVIIKKDNEEIGYYFNNRLWFCRAIEYFKKSKQVNYNMKDVFNTLKKGVTHAEIRMPRPIDYTEIKI